MKPLVAMVFCASFLGSALGCSEQSESGGTAGPAITSGGDESGSSSGENDGGSTSGDEGNSEEGESDGGTTGAEEESTGTDESGVSPPPSGGPFEQADETTLSGPGNPWRISASDGHIYVATANEGSGFYAFEVSDDGALTETAHVDADTGYVFDWLHVHEDSLYAVGQGNVVRYELSDPAKPAEAAKAETDSLWWAYPEVHGANLYVAGSHGEGVEDSVLYQLDANDLSLKNEVKIKGAPKNIWANEEFLVLIDGVSIATEQGHGGVEIFRHDDLEEAVASPELWGKSAIYGSRVSNERLYVGSCPEGPSCRLEVFDLSGLPEVTPLPSIELPQDNYASDVMVSSDGILIATMLGGEVIAYDLSDEDNPVDMGFIDVGDMVFDLAEVKGFLAVCQAFTNKVHLLKYAP